MSKTSSSRAKKAKPRSTAPSKAKSADVKAVAPSKESAASTELAGNIDVPALERDASRQGLYRWNFWLTIIFFLEAAAILLLSTTHDVTVTTSYLTTDPLAAAGGHTMLVAAMRHLFQVNIAFLVAAFLWVAALVHGITVSVYRKQFAAEVTRGVNRMRWLEYVVTGPIMLVTLALLGGIYDFATLVMIVVLSIAPLLLGLLLEIRDAGKRTSSWGLWRVACLLGFTPGAALIWYALNTHIYGAANLPGYVYGAYSTMLVVFVAYAVNFYLQRAKRGRWADYLFGERIFMVLSLVAKTALAWQIFAGLLHP